MRNYLTICDIQMQRSGFVVNKFSDGISINKVYE